MLLVLLASVVLNCPAIELKETKASSEDNALDMKLELVALPDNDLQKAQFKLTVTNASRAPLVLDKELITSFGPGFKTDLSEEIFHDDKKDVSLQEAEKLDKPKPDAAAERFLPLKPGEALSRMYDMAKPMKVVEEGHGTDKNHAHHGFYYEAMMRYHVPPAAKKLLVTVYYERGVWMMATAQFEQWHGKSAEALGVWNGRACSNSLLIEKK